MAREIIPANQEEREDRESYFFREIQDIIENRPLDLLSDQVRDERLLESFEELYDLQEEIHSGVDDDATLERARQVGDSIERIDSDFNPDVWLDSKERSLMHHLLGVKIDLLRSNIDMREHYLRRAKERAKEQIDPQGKLYVVMSRLFPNMREELAASFVEAFEMRIFMYIAGFSKEKQKELTDRLMHILFEEAEMKALFEQMNDLFKIHGEAFDKEAASKIQEALVRFLESLDEEGAKDLRKSLLHLFDAALIDPDSSTDLVDKQILRRSELFDYLSGPDLE